MTQHSLFDEYPEDKSLTIQERFEQFHAHHPDVYELFKRFAFELRCAGRQKYGAKSIMERIRWHVATSSAGDEEEEFKLNNIFTSRYVRLLINEHPEFAEFFELRRLQSP
ncbi:MAG TPA: hypothetical protein VH592_12780 [Gemmataceae bacterium]|jgi:hypothetical protein